jgi:predicted CDP-diglyceride synthetase/phosphatidate cytidylyltransferase
MVQRVVFTHGSVRFFKPFLPLDNLLFLPTAMIVSSDGCRKEFRQSKKNLNLRWCVSNFGVRRFAWVDHMTVAKPESARSFGALLHESSTS